MKIIAQLCFLFVCLLTNLLAEVNSSQLKNLRQKDYRRFENYHFDASSQLVSRISSAPSFLVEAMKEMDERYDYSLYPVTETDLAEIKKCLSLLPEAMKKVWQKKLIGIYFVHNLWGGGFTDFVLDEKGELYIIMLLNPGCLHFSLEDWLSAKEASALQIDQSDLSVKIKTGKGVSGLFYLFAHEGTHVMDYELGLSPWTEKDIQILQNRKMTNTAVNAGVWLDEKKPLEKLFFPDLTNISIYGFRGKPRLPISRVQAFYTVLKKSPWVSMYSTFSWAEDLAELSAFSIICEKLKAPIEVDVLKNKEIVFSFRPLESENVKNRLVYLTFLK
jgi:hypothetical protein